MYKLCAIKSIYKRTVKFFSFETRRCCLKIGQLINLSCIFDRGVRRSTCNNKSCHDNSHRMKTVAPKGILISTSDIHNDYHGLTVGSFLGGAARKWGTKKLSKLYHILGWYSRALLCLKLFNCYGFHGLKCLSISLYCKKSWLKKNLFITCDSSGGNLFSWELILLQAIPKFLVKPLAIYVG